MSAVTILYDFKFSEGRIFELCFPDAGVELKESRYQWMLIWKEIRYNLKFVSMTRTTRTFILENEINIDVCLDLVEKKLRINFPTNNEYDLTS